jgi:antitoxin HicB
MSTQHAPKLDYTVIYEPAEEGGYIVIAPTFGGAITQGETLEEARRMAIDAITGLVESYIEDDLPIPEDVELALEPVKEQVSITLSSD